MEPVHERLKLNLHIANRSIATMSNRLGFRMYRMYGCILNEINLWKTKWLNKKFRDMK